MRIIILSEPRSLRPDAEEGAHNSRVEGDHISLGGSHIPESDVGDSEIRQPHVLEAESDVRGLHDSQADPCNVEPRTFPGSSGRLDCRCSGSDSKIEPVDPNLVSQVVRWLIVKCRGWQQWNEARLSYRSPQEIVIYSDEALREEAHLEVPLQIKHQTTNPVISSSLASVPSETLGVTGLLGMLNQVLGTSYSADVPGLIPLLQQFIEERHYDFGMVYGYLRSFWFNDIQWTDDIQELLETREYSDRAARIKALDQERNVVTNPRIKPRRLWDLYSNRVIPIWTVRDSILLDYDGVWAISHSWMEESQRHNASTPINGYEWLVPLPLDVTLDRIRIELLNLGAVYVWLDVLCLRQEDSSKPEKEDLRVEEWKLDVPTIGNIYHDNPHIVTYLNGLGRPFAIGDIDHERHWLNRTWTLQEGSVNTLIGGMIPSYPFPLNMERSQVKSRPGVKAFLERLCTMLNIGQNYSGELFPALEIMLDRKASHEVDRIAGLAYILLSEDSRPPVYVREENNADNNEEAWSHLVMEMEPSYRQQLAFLYPTPGDGGVTWRPSWDQLNANRTLLQRHNGSVGVANCPDSVGKDGSNEISGYLLEECVVRHLAKHDAEDFCRHGELVVKAGGAIEGESIFAVTAHHQEPIPDDQTYVLFGPDLEFWMVGLYTHSGCIQKVSVVELREEQRRDTLALRALVRPATVTLV
ncbi:hypothetical protein NM688_g2246 [Phlebia brevispora]|uniref:Uncharacterized protein n=1 Tax=Phlebia brevispora TaxID=194682 RepID=A0ACC1T8X8_9APHY|nr:hypothetical protein NM688_g2246 [Phlebia brevispora]